MGLHFLLFHIVYGIDHLFMAVICDIVKPFYKINKFFPKFLKYPILLIYA